MKKALKRSLSLLLAITIIFSSAYVGLSEVDFKGFSEFIKELTPVFSVKSHAASESDLTFKLNDDGKSYCVYNCNVEANGKINIPSTYNGKPVTSIGYGTFSGCNNLTAITVDSGNQYFSSIDGVLLNKDKTELIYYPGGKTNTEYTIPDSVTSIGECAFDGCTSLTSVTIGNSVTSIGEHAFRNCTSLTSIIIPDSVTSIGEYAFGYCTSLTSVTIPDSVTSIGYAAFWGCDSLTSITIPDSVTSIGEAAFGYCTSLTSVDLGNGITSIDDSAFYGCVGLTSITIPDSVTSIGECAFDGCIRLESIIIPGSVVDIAEYAFEDCTNLETITIGQGLANKECHLLGLYNVKSIIINDGVTSIGDNAFRCLYSLESVVIPDSVTSIGEYAFLWTKIKSITIPENVMSIGEYAFHFTPLESVVIPDSVISIGDGIFSCCSSLETVVIGYGIECIPYETFAGCSNLASINIPESVTSIGGSAFGGCDSLTSITIPETVTNIGKEAFYGCTSLTSITIPDSVTSIGGDAFYDCSSAFTINANCNSYGAEYAKNNGINIQLTHTGTQIWKDKTPSTCAVAGAKELVCSVCNHVYETEELAMLEHKYSEWVITTEPTCTTVGSHSKTCASCGDVVTEAIPANGHNYSTEWTIDVAPSCYKEGSKARYCTVCGDKTDITTIPASGHTASNWIIEKQATCSTNGSKYKQCIDCGEVVETAIVYASGHIESNWIIESQATCTSEGYKYKQCIVCGEITNTLSTAFKDHTPGNWIIDKAANVNAAGSKHKECTACGKTLETATVPQLKPATPKLSSVANTPTGVKFVWGKVTGADNYVVYRRTYNASTKTWSGWQNIAKSITTNSYVDKNVTSGTYYIYTVRANNEAGLSGFDATGLKTYCLATPTLASVTNAATGVTVKWGKVTGATNYVVYRRAYNATTKKWSGWTNLGKTTATSFADKTAQSGNYYIYTVKALAGTYTSAYNTTGLKTYFLSAPALLKVASTTSGVKFTWGKVAGANGYIVYRRTYNATTKTWGGWTKLGTITGNTNVTYVDASAQKGTYYIYTTKAYYGSYTSAYNTTGLKVKDIY